ncbi:hypothetical protein ISN45_At05g034110 [Arabidopsis thaliana x Arabidopsis arenosa]|uniref:Crossover junction endonuclease MUS81 n=1 Tax=Arabidopsis thaliana x Arabidopsis arenosa TaxID=1240361 RepID=A0A8T2D1U3_9BRAS|nr:hypothetical protein ISN45_At05g034110 [Arabidopsis thaliana x Arabidopsis arenosa]
MGKHSCVTKSLWMLLTLVGSHTFLLRQRKEKEKLDLEPLRGWSCMSTLVHKGLVVKSRNPAKLTVDGGNVAYECIVRSGLLNPVNILSDDEMDPAQQAKKPRQVDLEGSRAKKFRSCNVGSTLNPCSSSMSHALKACSSFWHLMEPKE